MSRQNRLDPRSKWARRKHEDALDSECPTCGEPSKPKALCSACKAWLWRLQGMTAKQVAAYSIGLQLHTKRGSHRLDRIQRGAFLFRQRRSA
jgi:hypothetical protein